MDPAHLAAADIVLQNEVTENMQVHHDEAHKWYYLQDQSSTELLVFRQADSHPDGRVGMILPNSIDISSMGAIRKKTDGAARGTSFVVSEPAGGTGRAAEGKH